MFRFVIVRGSLWSQSWGVLIHVRGLPFAVHGVSCGRHFLVLVRRSFFSFVRRAVSFRPPLIVSFAAFSLRSALVIILIRFADLALEPVSNFFLWVELSFIVLQLPFKFG